MLYYRCPSCRIPLESKNHEAGRKVACPTCGQRMEVPGAEKKKTVVVERDDEDDDHPRRREYDDDLPPVRYRDDEDEGRPRRSRDEDADDLRPVRRKRRRSSTCECPNCGADEVPFERKEIAQEGWIVLVVLVVLFWPLFWIGLLMKQTFLVCHECGYKIRKVGSMTFG